MERTSFLAAMILAASVSGVRAASSVFVANRFRSDLPYTLFQQPDPLDWTDIPGTERNLNLPPGTAAISWTIHFDHSGPVLFRPVIGDVVPQDGLEYLNGRQSVGFWSVAVPGGPTVVRLPVKDSDGNVNIGFGGSPWNHTTWTLTVFPDAGNVPTIGTWGLVVLLLGVCVAGSLIVTRRRASAV